MSMINEIEARKARRAEYENKWREENRDKVIEYKTKYRERWKRSLN